jgi:hypothetical protein
MPSKTLLRERSTPRADWTTRPYWVHSMLRAWVHSMLRAWVHPVTHTRDRESDGAQPLTNGAASGRPGDACLELVQGSLAGLGSDEPDTKELRRGDHEHVRDGGDGHGQVLEEELVALFLRQIGLNSTQINKNSEALKIGNMMKGSGGGGRQAFCRRRAPAGSSNFSIGHADWESD